MLWASHVAESLRDSVVPRLACGVSLGEADLRGDVQPVVSFFLTICARVLTFFISPPLC